ncbi:transcriptional regulator family: Helix-turn-helix and Homeodomain-like HTH [Penicillium manginii]|uniref:transcriptional regulator family: Helix-turn-helix and Homeodomain-like HTH n=1 Tax=Penicillium manginii TaxID=203109 RepID=UPI002546BDD6|nr:transcriptional regulator family: Helix-turn-helix and Homeodomain-like HTH [Penicillium manginii]KAJ5749486.1 transcriptional regulator family: Helix-turn-helix and Homeodomain-like HTH [Penicillium manginii]
MAAEFNVARSTIYSTIKRFREHQTLKSLPRSGAPKVYSAIEQDVVSQFRGRTPANESNFAEIGGPNATIPNYKASYFPTNAAFNVSLI